MEEEEEEGERWRKRREETMAVLAYVLGVGEGGREGGGEEGVPVRVMMREHFVELMLCLIVRWDPERRRKGGREGEKEEEQGKGGEEVGRKAAAGVGYTC